MAFNINMIISPRGSQIQGTLLAPSNIEDWNKIGHERSQYWILFKNVAALDVEGGGTINGNGEPWWHRSCKIDTSRVRTSACMPHFINLSLASSFLFHGYEIRFFFLMTVIYHSHAAL